MHHIKSELNSRIYNLKQMKQIQLTNFLKESSYLLLKLVLKSANEALFYLIGIWFCLMINLCCINCDMDVKEMCD